MLNYPVHSTAEKEVNCLIFVHKTGGDAASDMQSVSEEAFQGI